MGNHIDPHLVYRSRHGMWGTDHDIHNYTPADERRGYRRLSLTMAGFAVAFLILAVTGVRPFGLAGVWWVGALLCTSLVMVFVPMAWFKNPNLVPGESFHPQLNPSRADHYWFERGISDEVYEDDDEPLDE